MVSRFDSPARPSLKTRTFLSTETNKHVHLARTGQHGSKPKRELGAEMCNAMCGCAIPTDTRKRTDSARCVCGGGGGSGGGGERNKTKQKRHRRCRVGVMGRWKGRRTFHHPQIRQCTLYFLSSAAQAEVEATRERTEALCPAAEEVDDITLS